MQFPDLSTALALEFRLGDRWVDVTDDLVTALPIQVGRANEAANITPSEVSFELDNTRGDYTPDHPASQYWPDIGLGVPVRVSVDASTLTTPGGYAQGFESGLGGWTAPAGTASLSTVRAHSGTQSMRIDSTGSTVVVGAQSPNIPAAPGAHQHLSVWVWRDTFTDPDVLAALGFVDAAGDVIQVSDLIRNPAPAGQWTRVSVGGLAPPGAAALFVQVVSYSPAAFFDDAEHRIGTDGHRAVRFLGDIASLDPYWPNGDRSDAATGEPGEARVAITAAGVVRRLSQGAPALRSAMYRSTLGQTNTEVAYWPLEDARDAQRAASAVPQVPAMATTAGRQVDFAALDIADGSEPLPNWRQSTGSLSGALPARAFSDRTVMVGGVVWVEGPETWNALQINVNGGTWTNYRLNLGANITLTAIDDDDTTFTLLTHAAAGVVDTGPHWVAVGIADGGTSARVSLIIDGEFAESANIAAARGSGVPTSVVVRPRTSGGGAALGHLYVTTAIFAGSDTLERVLGHTGETAGERIERLCNEEGVPVSFVGDMEDTLPVGPQRPATLLTLLTEAAAADGGILSENLNTAGLTYRTRASMYNQTPALVLDASSTDGGDIVPPFRPTLDDQAVRNDITVSRSRGGSARVVAEDGPRAVGKIGRYDEQLSLSLASDEQLPAVAGWRLNLGTATGMRYPVVSPAIGARPELLPAWVGLRLGDRVDVTGLPPQHPAGTVPLLALGFAETLTPSWWDVRLNAAPAAPWTVATRAGNLPGPEPSRYDTAGCQLSAAVDATATQLPVTTTRGPAWTAAAADLPFDVAIGGEVIRVTAVTGSGTAQTFTATRGVNGAARPHPAATAVHLARPAIRAL